MNPAYVVSRDRMEISISSFRKRTTKCKGAVQVASLDCIGVLISILSSRLPLQYRDSTQTVPLHLKAESSVVLHVYFSEQKQMLAPKPEKPVEKTRQ